MSLGKQFEEFSDYIYEHCNREHLAHMHFIVLGLAGMKIFILPFLLSSIAIAPLSGFATTVKDTIEVMEDKLGIDGTNMYTMINAWELSQQLKKTCGTDAITRGEQYISAIKQNLNNTYPAMGSAELLRHSRRLYSAIETAHDKAQALNDSDFCTLKYVFYTMQGRLREKHIELLTETGIINDFNGFGSSDTVYGVETKLDMLDVMIDENKKYKDLLDEQIAFNRKNSSFKDSLSTDAQKILEKTEVLMVLTVYKALYKLKQAGLFEVEDIDILKDLVDFEYVDSCQSFHGKYELQQMIDSNGHHVSYDTQALNLKVNLCGNYFVLRDIDIIFEKIVTHELAHHFYYYHDEKRGAFEDICRKSGDTRNSLCKATDFVTEYAQTLAMEDYAEHFMYWFLDLVENNSAILQKKTNHFENYN